MERIIFHIDIDAFFASVEQRDNPALRGKPIAVIGPRKRTVILTASYEARKYGVKTGMMLKQGLALCPDLILVRAHNQKYMHESEKIIRILQEFTPEVEVFSIDEAFLDMSGCTHLFGGTLKAGREMKKRIYDRVGLTCSIGIAPTKVLAKLASDMQKPDGLVWLKQEEIPKTIGNMEVDSLWGIGFRLKAHLAQMGIQTVGQLARCPVWRLESHFGVYGEFLHRIANGKDDIPVIRMEEEPDAKSIGHTLTVPKDLYTTREIKKYLLQVAEEVGRRMRKGGYVGRTICLILRFTTFETSSQRTSLSTFTCDSKKIYDTATLILNRLDLRGMGVRLVGITVSNLHRHHRFFSLLPGEEKRRRVTEAVDRINDKYGEWTVTRADLLWRASSIRSIPPSWRPSSSRKVIASTPSPS